MKEMKIMHGTMTTNHIVINQFCVRKVQFLTFLVTYISYTEGFHCEFPYVYNVS
jgi:hypothetical protein